MTSEWYNGEQSQNVELHKTFDDHKNGNSNSQILGGQDKCGIRSK